MIRAWIVLPLLAALAAGCGTTLPQTSQYSGGSSQGLGGSPGSSVPGSPTAAGQQSTSPDGSSLPVNPSTGGAGSGDSGSNPTGSSGLAAGATASGQPSTRATTSGSTGSGSALVKTPIQIGFMAAASASAAVSALGAHSENQETPQQAFAYFVSKLNKQGGIDGRRIEVVQSFINPISSNYDVQASAACADFTQDNHVAVVFSVENAYYSQGFSACLASANVPEFLAVTGGVDPAILSQYPTLFSPTAPTVNRRFAALINGLSANGYFTKQTKIGVVVEDCPFNEEAYTSTVAPELKAHGFTFYRRDIACIHGFGDAAGAISAIQGQVLPLRTAGVTRVMFVSGFEGTEAEYFERQAALQGYQPGYAFTSTADIGDNAEGFSNAALARVEGVGWEPDLDVTKLPAGTAATRRCHALWNGFGPAAARVNRQNNDTTCEEFFLLQTVLKQTRGNSNASDVESALESLGTSYDSPLVLNGATKYSAAVKDAPVLFSTFGYKASCHCIAYTGSPKPLA